MDDLGRDPEPTSPWPFVAILVGFKVVTLAAVLVYVTSWSAVWFVLATHALWIFGVGFFVWAPALVWLRLVRARARRRKLLAEEFHVEETHQNVR